jgi:hypothetical protein
MGYRIQAIFLNIFYFTWDHFYDEGSSNQTTNHNEEGKILLGLVNKLFVFKRLLTSPSNVLLYYLE